MPTIDSFPVEELKQEYRDVSNDPTKLVDLRWFCRWESGRGVAGDTEHHSRERRQRNTQRRDRYLDNIEAIRDNHHWIESFSLSFTFDIQCMILVTVSQEYDHERAVEWMERNILENYVVEDRENYFNGQIEFDE